MNENYISPKDLYNKLNASHPGLVGINKIYKWCKQKDFPAVKLGGKFLILEQSALDWIQKKVTYYYKK